MPVNKLLNSITTENSEESITVIEEESEKLWSDVKATEDSLQNLYSQFTDAPLTDELEKEVDNCLNSCKKAKKNILKSYVKTVRIYDEFSTRWKDVKKHNKKKIVIFTPNNTEIDVAEFKTAHFAGGINIYNSCLFALSEVFLG